MIEENHPTQVSKLGPKRLVFGTPKNIIFGSHYGWVERSGNENLYHFMIFISYFNYFYHSLCYAMDILAIFPP